MLERENDLQCHLTATPSTSGAAYGGRHNRSFQNDDEMNAQIKSVWNEIASHTGEIRKEMKKFVPRLKAEDKMSDYSIKTVFG